MTSWTDLFALRNTGWHYTFMNKKAGEIQDLDPDRIMGRQIWTEFPDSIGQPFNKACYHRHGPRRNINCLEAMTLSQRSLDGISFLSFVYGPFHPIP